MHIFLFTLVLCRNKRIYFFSHEYYVGHSPDFELLILISSLLLKQLILSSFPAAWWLCVHSVSFDFWNLFAAAPLSFENSIKSLFPMQPRERRAQHDPCRSSDERLLSKRRERQPGWGHPRSPAKAEKPTKTRASPNKSSSNREVKLHHNNFPLAFSSTKSEPVPLKSTGFLLWTKLEEKRWEEGERTIKKACISKLEFS